MIKCEYENREKIVRLTFSSNNNEVDLLDAIGNAILSQAPKRGQQIGESIVIDILKED